MDDKDLRIFELETEVAYLKLSLERITALLHEAWFEFAELEDYEDDNIELDQEIGVCVSNENID